VGSVFLEELPCHFSAAPFRQDWSAVQHQWGVDGAGAKDDGMPWDLRRFRHEIRAELGEDFDMMNEKHRLWWGKKYTQVLEEIHREMKRAGGSRVVLYWHQTMFSTLDSLAPGQSLFTPGTVPVAYADIVKPEVCDGIFGYPNSPDIWKRLTLAPVQKLNCLFFSQLAQRPQLRLCRFEEQVQLARVEHPGNLGTFLYIEPGRRWRAWNQLAYPEDGSYWTVRDYARRFAWDYRIGLEVVERNLLPEVEMHYSLDGLKKGEFAHFEAQIRNPRHPSWCGGNAAVATLPQVGVTLAVPPGFSIPLENNAGSTLDLGDLGPEECIPADWWVRLDQDSPAPVPQQGFRITVIAERRKLTERAFTAPASRIPAFQAHALSRAGDSWVEPAYDVPADYVPVVEIRATDEQVLQPRLVCADRYVLFRGTLAAKDRLVTGPGARATLFREPLLARTFTAVAGQSGSDGVFSESYHVFSSAHAAVTSGTTCRLRLAGWARDGGNCHVIAHFAGNRAGAAAVVDQSCLANRFTTELATVEETIEVPAFDGNQATVVLYFYRLASKGTVCYHSYELRTTDVPETGLDVSARLEGVLAQLDLPFTVWRYQDLSDPSPAGDAKVAVRFLPPAETRAGGQ
jgi:hypothetical protein